MSTAYAKPFVTVIIPVYNDNRRLEKCLDSLQKQTYPKELFEIIVVDNGSNKSPSPIIDKFQKVKLIVENMPGSYAARNRGLSVAKGTIVAFTDSDCIPNKDWIEQGVNVLTSFDQRNLIIGGKIEFFFKKPYKPNIYEIYDIVSGLDQKLSIETGHFVLTANLITFKHIFDQVGLFNSKMKSGGDTEWGNRAFKKGISIEYAPQAIVYHPARSSYNAIKKKTIRTSGGRYRLEIESGKNPLYFLNDLLPPIKRILRVCKDSRIKGYKSKLMVSYLIFHLKYVALFEKFRIFFGGQPQRS